ncbi:884_t:CDS:1, partial [Funneliformis geosporum]
MPFENATCEFSGNTYVTLSWTIPIIKERIFDLADKALSNAEEFSNENTVFEIEMEIPLMII